MSHSMLRLLDYYMDGNQEDFLLRKKGKCERFPENTNLSFGRTSIIKYVSFEL